MYLYEILKQSPIRNSYKLKYAKQNVYIYISGLFLIVMS